MGGAVAAGHQLTAEAAIEMLSDGGNAFDAVTAGIMTACVVEPVLASLGGGGFLMVRTTDREMRLIDFFVDSPRSNQPPESLKFESVNADFGATKQEFHIGTGSAANPGMIPGLFHINEQLGLLPLSRLIEPAVNHAKGHRVSDYQARLATVVSPIQLHTAESRKLAAPAGELLKEGEIFKNLDLAETFEALAEDGLGLAIDGPLARAMLDGHETGGFLTADDFRAYQVMDRQPLTMDFENATICLNPPPSMGGPLIFNMLNRFSGQFSIKKIADAICDTDRFWRQDPKNIDALLNCANPGNVNSNLIVQQGTTHISAIDALGNAAAVTLTNGSGNGEIVKGFGFMMNNMLGERDVIHSEFHCWKPGTRLSSMMSPTLVLGRNGEIFSIGSGGSNRIRTAIFQVLVRLLVNGEPLPEAVNASRVHIEKDFIDCEFGFDERELALLLTGFPEKHQVWDDHSMYFGGVHAVSRDLEGNFDGVGDHRRGGIFLTT